jgi:hypothetical protein
MPYEGLRLWTSRLSKRRRVLPKTERTIFFFLYHCVPTWTELLELLRKEVGKDFRLATVQGYARKARALLVENNNSPEIERWHSNFVGARPSKTK